MKKFLSPFFLIAILLSGIAVGSSSCKEEKTHATKICLPDSTLVGKSLPVIDGTLSEYFSIVPQPYFINLSDSILSLKVMVRHEKTYVPNKLLTLAIGNPDSLGSKMPYVELVDSTGTAIKNFRMVGDSVMVKQLETLITGKPGTDTELTFISPNPLTVDQKDSLALVAKNFKIVANVMSTVDSAQIDNMLSSYKRAVANLNNWVAGFGGGAPIGMAAQAVQGAINNEKAQAAKLRNVESYMTPEQVAQFNKIKATRTKVSWAR